jgi:hypothetical protein
LLKLLRYGLVGVAGAITLAVLILMIPSDLSRWIRNQAGVHLYERGQYGLAFTLFERLAAEGSAVGQNNLGVLHERGLGTRRNPREAESSTSERRKPGSPRPSTTSAGSTTAGRRGGGARLVRARRRGSRHVHAD